jgi:aryl-alcohol dehydrogenase-like predicted oxidoreductase
VSARAVEGSLRRLDTDYIDLYQVRIDQLVGPGVTINPDDDSYGEAELTSAATARDFAEMERPTLVGRCRRETARRPGHTVVH